MKIFKNSNTWMAVLTFTAIVLGVLLLSQQRQAQAVMLNAQSGYAMMTTGTPGGDEVLMIVDKTTEKMVIYRLNGNSLDLMAAQYFGGAFHR